MAGWVDLLEANPLKAPRQMFLCSGEISSLVWDKVNAAASQYDTTMRVTTVEQLATPSMFGTDMAYVLVNPSAKLLTAVVENIKNSRPESYFILYDSDLPKDQKTLTDYIKKRAQQSKHYYSVSAPKTEAAQDKMVSHFLMRWAVTRETAHKVCSVLEFSPGRLYLFDQQILLCTGGKVLPSSQTKKLVSDLLGSDTTNLVVSHIVNGEYIDASFAADFTLSVLHFLHTTINHARLIHGAWRNGDSTVSSVSKETGLTQFLVVRSWGLAEMYNPAQLRAKEDLVLFGLDNYRSPELLSVVSRLWR